MSSSLLLYGMRASHLDLDCNHLPPSHMGLERPSVVERTTPASLPTLLNNQVEAVISNIVILGKTSLSRIGTADHGPVGRSLNH